MPKVSEHHLQARRKQILEAARRCFGLKGFHQTTMRDIFAEAGLSPGAVYQYFRGKDDLIRAVAEEGRLAATERMSPSEAAPSDPISALLASVQQFLACLRDDAVLASLRVDVRLAGEALQDGPVRDVVLENYDHLIGGFAELIGRAQQAGQINEGLSAHGTARLLVAMFQGLEFQKVVDREADVTVTADVVEALITGRFSAQD